MMRRPPHTTETVWTVEDLLRAIAVAMHGTPPTTTETEVPFEARGIVRFPSPTPPSPPAPPTPPPGRFDPVQATVRIRSGNAGCTGTILAPALPGGPQRLLTAAHCVAGIGAMIEVTHKNGTRYRATVIRYNRRDDLALAHIEGDGRLPIARLALRSPGSEDSVWHMGYGIDIPGNRVEGKIINPGSELQTSTLRLSVSSGDSGAGIFRVDDGSLVGVVSATGGGITYAPSWGQIRRIMEATEMAIVEVPPIWLEDVDEPPRV